MKRVVKKIWRRVIPQKYRLIIYRIRVLPSLLAGRRKFIQDLILYFRVKLYAKKTGLILSKITSPHNYPLDTFKSLDLMILNKLQLLQFGIPFQESKFLILSSPPYGFGAAVLDPLSKGLTYSYLYNRVLLFNSSRLVYDFCYEPISIHSLEDINRKYNKKAIKFNFLPQKEKVVYSSFFQTFNSPLLPDLLNSVHPLSLPLHSIYTRGLILGSFLKLKQEYRAHIEKKRKEIGFKNPILGVHIRQGKLDVSFERHRFIPVQKYLEIVKQVVHQTGIKTVFVTTDSEEVIQQLPKNSEIDFIYDDNEKRYDLLNARMLMRHPELKKQETMSSVKNIHLLADCNYIIAGPGNWFNNSLSLSYFRNKKLNGILIKKHNVIKKSRENGSISYTIKGKTDDYYIDYIITNDDNFQPATTELPTSPFFY